MIVLTVGFHLLYRRYIFPKITGGGGGEQSKWPPPPPRVSAYLGLVSDKVLHDKVFNVVKNPKHDGYLPAVASVVYKLVDKTCSCGVVKSEFMPNHEEV